MRQYFLYAFIFSTLVPASIVFAASGDSTEDVGKGNISIEQVGPEEDPDVIGNWTLIQPGNDRFDADEKEFSFSSSDAGIYTFTADSPDGATASIEFYRNGELEESVPRPQISFTLHDQDEISIIITYSYTRTGLVSVTSTPKGLTFTMKGPNNTEFSGKTPQTFHGVPEGQYTAYFDNIENCITPKPISGRLIKDGRVNLTIEVACDALEDTDQQKDEDKALEYVTVTVDDRQIIFYDAPIGMWFAPYVHEAAKTGIITGYRDGSGNPLGKFGPENNVTIAELAKIAHKIAAIDESKIRVPVENTRAQGTWFEQYFASAEQRWWEVYRDRRIDPSRPATRAEVVVTLLRALNVPREWPNGKVFADVPPTRPYAASVVTAALDGLVDQGGSFRPNDPINRAEIAKILAKAIEIYIEKSAEFQPESL